VSTRPHLPLTVARTTPISEGRNPNTVCLQATADVEALDLPCLRLYLLLVFVRLLEPECHQLSYLRSILRSMVLPSEAVQLGGKELTPHLPFFGPQCLHVLGVEYAAIGAGTTLPTCSSSPLRRILARLELSTVHHLSCGPGSGVVAHSASHFSSPSYSTASIYKCK
jgi:hypothetical protein